MKFHLCLEVTVTTPLDDCTIRLRKVVPVFKSIPDRGMRVVCCSSVPIGPSPSSRGLSRALSLAARPFRNVVALSLPGRDVAVT